MNPRKVRLPDLDQLLLAELARTRGVVVVEPLDISELALGEITVGTTPPVAVLESFELVADEALESGSKERPVHRDLRDPTDEEVDVVGVGVDQLQPLHDLLGDEVGKVVETVNFLHSADFSECIVSWQPVVPPSLDVQGNQVHPKAVVLRLEEVVGQLLAEDVVELKI